MYAALLGERRFYGLLLRVDEDLAAQARAAGCRVCGQMVHAGNFRRKARGVPHGLESDYAWRLSFCCARRECRKRVTPPSMRFLGRKVYLGAVVMLVSALRCGATPVPIGQLPQSLLERFAGSPATALLALLRFVLPITGGDTAARAM